MFDTIRKWLFPTLFEQISDAVALPYGLECKEALEGIYADAGRQVTITHSGWKKVTVCSASAYPVRDKTNSATFRVPLSTDHVGAIIRGVLVDLDKGNAELREAHPELYEVAAQLADLTDPKPLREFQKCLAEHLPEQMSMHVTGTSWGAKVKIELRDDSGYRVRGKEYKGSLVVDIRRIGLNWDVKVNETALSNMAGDDYIRSGEGGKMTKVTSPLEVAGVLFGVFLLTDD